MCVNTIKILNRSKVRVAGLSPTFYNVPCGKCWQCQQARRDSYLVRNFYEFLHTKHLNGWCLFLTLTYRDSTLPHVDSIPVFCKSDVQKYLKRFRINLTRYLAKHGYTSEQSKELVKNNIRYFCTSENGEKRKRPHYHILIYCLSPLINRWIGRKIACDSWKLGFAVPSEENNGFVTSMAGIKYVTKYVGKSMTDDVYYNQVLARFKQKFSDDFGLIKLDKKFSYYRLEENKPFMLSSKGLGLFGLSDSCDSQYKLVYDSFYNNTCFIADDDKTVTRKQLPMYYKRKFCFDVETEKMSYDGKPVYHVTYKLNEFGLAIKNKHLQDRYDNFDKNVVSALNSTIDIPSFMNDVTSQFGKGLTYEYCIEFLSRTLKEKHFKDYALLYSAYSYFLNEDELKSHYHHLPFNDVVSFRNHVNFSDSSVSVTYQNIDSYYSFYLDILQNIFYFQKEHHNYQMCLALYELFLLHVNKAKTSSQFKKDVDFQSNKFAIT